MVPAHRDGENAAVSDGVRAVGPADWVDAYGHMLYRYALARVRRPDIAEDLVQETFVAALSGWDRFAGRSSESTWLTGILRHKILDHFRARGRGAGDAASAGHEDWLGDFFDDRGRWLQAPDPKAIDPGVLLEREEFWAALEACVEGLAPKHREAFVRRIMEGEETVTICKAMNVTPTNVWVILFRARTQVRRCLMLTWFQNEGGVAPT